MAESLASLCKLKMTGDQQVTVMVWPLRSQQSILPGSLPCTFTARTFASIRQEPKECFAARASGNRREIEGYLIASKENRPRLLVCAAGLLPRTIRLVRPIPVGCLLVQLGSLVLGAPGEMGVQPC